MSHIGQFTSFAAFHGGFPGTLKYALWIFFLSRTEFFLCLTSKLYRKHVFSYIEGDRGRMTQITIHYLPLRLKKFMPMSKDAIELLLW